MSLADNSVDNKVSWVNYDYYSDPCYYDLIFSDSTADEAKLLILLFNLYIAPCVHTDKAVLLEPACGSGRIMHYLLSNNFPVNFIAGFDREELSLRAAHNKFQRNNISKEKYFLFKDDLSGYTMPSTSIDRYDIIYLFTSTLQHVEDTEKLFKHFFNSFSYLNKYGCYVFTIELCDYSIKEARTTHIHASDDNINLAATTTIFPPHATNHTETIRVRIKAESEGKCEHLQTQFDLRSYSARELFELLFDVLHSQVAVQYGMKHLVSYNYANLQHIVEEKERVDLYEIEWPVDLNQAPSKSSREWSSIEAQFEHNAAFSLEELECVIIVLQRTR
jgi:SAM-dependent methyltransferase